MKTFIFKRTKYFVRRHRKGKVPEQNNRLSPYVEA